MELKGRILVYSILGCPHCMLAKNILRELDIPYTDVRLEIYPREIRYALKERTGKAYLPQIFFNAHFIGGTDDLQKLVTTNKMQLDKLIGELAVTPPPSDAPEPPDPSTATKSNDPGQYRCELDEYYELVQEIKKSSLIKAHRKGFAVMKNSFTGKEFIDWVVSETTLERHEALEMGQNLVDSHFVLPVHDSKGELFKDGDVCYRLLEDMDFSSLNVGRVTICEPREAIEVAGDLRNMILRLHAAFLSKDGKEVDYNGMRNSVEFEHYRRLAQELQRLNVESCDNNQKLAFFINVYNALVIHANIVKGPPTNLWQRYKFFNNVKYLIGAHEYSLQDIENGILRANRRGVGMLSKPFRASDPRLDLILSQAEPLIHFALVCGAKSCPPIKTYTADGVREQLTTAAEAFLEGDDGCAVDVNKKVVELSMIFKWYRQDFGSTDEQVLQWVHDHMLEGDKKDALQGLLRGKFKVKYLKYDWSSNAKRSSIY